KTETEEVPRGESGNEKRLFRRFRNLPTGSEQLLFLGEENRGRLCRQGSAGKYRRPFTGRAEHPLPLGRQNRYFHVKFSCERLKESLKIAGMQKFHSVLLTLTAETLNSGIWD